jgi:probable rRNA maturation factor
MTRCRVRVVNAAQFTPLLRRAVRLAIKNERLPSPCMADVFLISDSNVRRVNKERRNVDAFTDVLSFPALNPGEVPSPDPDTGRIFLGDILIAAGRTGIQARRYGHSYERELVYLAVHGALHLLGHNHETEWDRAVMRQKEEAVMERMGLVR